MISREGSVRHKLALNTDCHSLLQTLFSLQSFCQICSFLVAPPFSSSSSVFSSRVQAAAGGVQCHPRTSGGVCAGSQERPPAGNFPWWGARSSVQWRDLPAALGEAQRLRSGRSRLSSGELTFYIQDACHQTSCFWFCFLCLLSFSQSFRCSLRTYEKASDLWEL